MILLFLTAQIPGDIAEDMLLHHVKLMIRGAAQQSGAAGGEAHGDCHVVVHRAIRLIPFSFGR